MFTLSVVDLLKAFLAKTPQFLKKSEVKNIGIILFTFSGVHPAKGIPVHRGHQSRMIIHPPTSTGNYKIKLCQI